MQIGLASGLLGAHAAEANRANWETVGSVTFGSFLALVSKLPEHRWGRVGKLERLRG